MATNTHVHTNKVVTTSGTVGGDVSVTATGTGRVGVSESIATATTNQLLTIAFPQTNLKSVVMYSDQAVTLSINGASDDTPDQTISLQAGKALTWYTGGYFTVPLNQAVTSMYVTNVSGATANLEIEALYDGTP